MGNGTGISWTDATWNPMRGCSRTIAAGAAQSGCGDPSGGGCYAERNGYRFAGPGLPYEGLVRMTPHGARWTGKVRIVDEHLLDPIRWSRPRQIFTTSVSDPFHERYTNEAIAIVVGVMVVTRRHIHQMLTKRARRMREWFGWVIREAAAANGGVGMSPAMFCFTLLQRYGHDKRDAFTDADRRLVSRREIVDAALSAPWPLPNLWPGVSVENQAAADDRVNDLLATTAALRWLSCEPLLAHLDLGGFLSALSTCADCTSGEQASAAASGSCDVCADRPATVTLPGISWVIAGCESGPGARPCDVAWLRSLRDQCAHTGVPFWLKQANARDWIPALEHGPGSWHPATGPIRAGDGSKRKPGGVIELPYLDGVQHAAFPEIS